MFCDLGLHITKLFKQGSCFIKPYPDCTSHLSCDPYANHISAGRCALGSLSISKLLADSLSSVFARV